ncbi:MAG: hypothetical protein QME96_15020, partial [Myxococcota bacterium]|nr:hypothetical protein [Myxococcota bacterium]
RDNDLDGATDCDDPECADFLFCAGLDADGDADATNEDGEATGDAPDCPPEPGDGCGSDEVCGDGLDNDCDGAVDEPEAGCTCEPGTFQRCYGGPPGRAGVGGCVFGWQSCAVADVGTWNACEGWIAPAEDVCDGKDNDCDGCHDEGAACDRAGFSCPDFVDARPVRWYELRCYDFYSGRGTCEWSVEPPRASRAGIAEDPRAGYTRFYMDVAGDYVVHVRAVNEWGMERRCDFAVRARSPGLHVHMFWNDWSADRNSDMDLHLHRDPPRNEWLGLDDCWYNNCGGYAGYYDIDWGYPDSPIVDCGQFPAASDWDVSARGSCPNPRNEQEGFSGRDDVETIGLDNPRPADRFRIAVQYGARTGLNNRSAPTTANVRIWCGGVPIAALGPATLDAYLLWSGDIWRVADVEFDAAGDSCAVVPVVPLPGYDVRPYESWSEF